MIWSILLIWFGPKILESSRHAIHQHLNIVLGVVGLGLLLLALWVTRKVFDRRKGVDLPVEDGRDVGVVDHPVGPFSKTSTYVVPELP